MLQYLIPLDSDIKRSINSHQGSTTIMFLNTTGGLTFIMTSIDSGPTTEHHEARFIGKENCPPLIPSTNFLKSFSEMKCREDVSLHRSPCLKTILT